MRCIHIRCRTCTATGDSPFAHGYYLPVRYDLPAIHALVGGATHITPLVGGVGVNRTDNSYVYDGDVCTLARHLPFSLHPDREAVAVTFVDDLKTHIAEQIEACLADMTYETRVRVVGRTTHAIGPVVVAVAMGLDAALATSAARNINFSTDIHMRDASLYVARHTWACAVANAYKQHFAQHTSTARAALDTYFPQTCVAQWFVAGCPGDPRPDVDVETALHGVPMLAQYYTAARGHANVIFVTEGTRHTRILDVSNSLTGTGRRAHFVDNESRAYAYRKPYVTRDSVPVGRFRCHRWGDFDKKCGLLWFVRKLDT